VKEEPNCPSSPTLAHHHHGFALAEDASGWYARPTFIIIVFVFAWLQTLLMHDTESLHLPQKMDPMGRVVGCRNRGAPE